MGNRWDSRLCGAFLGLAVTGVYFIGAGRAYGYDASVTVHQFVATPSLLDPLHRQALYNNHVLFSFVDHLVYSATGSRREWVLRIVPIVASGVAAGVLTWAVARRLGRLAGIAAGMVVAASPLLVANGREVRGYSLLLLACVLSTVLLADLLSAPGSRLKVGAYVTALAAGIATHLFGLAMLPIHAAIVQPRRAELRRWLPRWLAAAAIGLVAYVGVAATMVDAHQRRDFRAFFPVELAKTLLGANLLPAALIAIPLAVGGLQLVLRRWAVSAGVVAAVLVLVAWAVAPHDLYPRFWLWLVPAVAYVAAVGVSRNRVLMLAVVAFVAVEAIRLAPHYARSDVANRGAAQLAARVRRAGGVSCGSEGSVTAMEAYADRVRVVHRTSRPPSCTVVFRLLPVTWHEHPALPASWRGVFHYRKVLAAADPGAAFSRSRLP